MRSHLSRTSRKSCVLPDVPIRNLNTQVDMTGNHAESLGKIYDGVPQENQATVPVIVLLFIYGDRLKVLSDQTLIS